jgi:hypothetical protein
MISTKWITWGAAAVAAVVVPVLAQATPSRHAATGPAAPVPLASAAGTAATASQGHSAHKIASARHQVAKHKQKVAPARPKARATPGKHAAPHKATAAVHAGHHARTALPAPAARPAGLPPLGLH